MSETKQNTENRAGSDCVDEYLNAIRGTWDSDDPQILVWDFGPSPVVADVGGDLRTISSNVIYASRIDRESVLGAINDFGEPRVQSLALHRHRFDKDDLEDLHPDESGDIEE